MQFTLNDLHDELRAWQVSGESYSVAAPQSVNKFHLPPSEHVLTWNKPDGSVSCRALMRLLAEAGVVVRRRSLSHKAEFRLKPANPIQPLEVMGLPLPSDGDSIVRYVCSY